MSRMRKYPPEISVGVNLSGELAVVPNDSLSDFSRSFRPQKPARYVLEPEANVIQSIGNPPKQHPVRKCKKKVAESFTANRVETTLGPVTITE